jgi:hypothetical protein
MHYYHVTCHLRNNIVVWEWCFTIETAARWNYIHVRKVNKIVMLTESLIYLLNESVLFQQTCQYHRNICSYFPLDIAFDIYSRMERSNAQADTVLHHTSAVMVTETAETWVMRCIVLHDSLVAAIVLRANMNVAIICVWTREISVMGQMIVVTTQMRAQVSVVSLLFSFPWCTIRFVLIFHVHYDISCSF